MKKEQIIQDFYENFKILNSAGMTKYYSDNVTFCDPAFGELRGNEAAKMWEMLCKNANDFELTFANIIAKDNVVTANWSASYTFSQTGNRVTNNITAIFIFEGDKIISHIDTFSLWKWSTQALGFKGFLFGGLPFFKKKLQSKTKSSLKKYMST